MKKSEWIDRLINENKSQLDNIRRGRTELDMSYEDNNNCFTFSKDIINNMIKNNKEEMIYKEFAKKIKNDEESLTNKSVKSTKSLKDSKLSNNNAYYNADLIFKKYSNKLERPDIQLISEKEEILALEPKINLLEITKELKVEHSSTQTEMELSCPDCPEHIIQKENLLSEITLIKEELQSYEKLKLIYKETNEILEVKEKQEQEFQEKIIFLEKHCLNLSNFIENLKLHISNEQRVNTELDQHFTQYKFESENSINYLSSSLDKTSKTVNFILNEINKFVDKIYDDELIKKSKRIIDFIETLNLNQSLCSVESIIRRKFNWMKNKLNDLKEVNKLNDDESEYRLNTVNFSNNKVKDNNNSRLNTEINKNNNHIPKKTKSNLHYDYRSTDKLKNNISKDNSSISISNHSDISKVFQTNKSKQKDKLKQKNSKSKI